MTRPLFDITPSGALTALDPLTLDAPPACPPATAAGGATPTTPDLTITVYGQPKPKGSLRHVGHGRMVEQLAGSKPWREAVKYAALEARTVAMAPTLAGPVAVHIAITVDKPKSAPKRRRSWPITRTSGDIDKHVRNVLDALVDAAVVGDDSQVVKVVAEKGYPDEGPDFLLLPGGVIRVYRIEADDAA